MAVEPLCLDDDLVNQCNEIRAIASKNWLNSAHVSLHHLDQIKTSVYNVGLHDANDLKATNVSARGQRSHSYTDLTTNPPLTKVSLQRNAWGSNGSIPDLLNQQSSRSYGSRPESAKTATRRTRPPSAKKTRPQSAKDSQLPPRPPAIGVKGARYDPTGRPPKLACQHGGVGWVGPPAGMKFADEQRDNAEHLESQRSTGASPPPAPMGTPVPSALYDEAEIMNVHQEIEINLPSAGDDTYAYDDDGAVRLTYTHGRSSVEPKSENETVPPRPTPEPIHLSLPTMDDLVDDDDDSDLDTERLIQEAERHTPSLHQTYDSRNAASNQSNAQDKMSKVMQISSDIAQEEPAYIEDNESDIFSLSNEPGTSSYRQNEFDDDVTGEWSEEENYFVHRDDVQSRGRPLDRVSVKFSEDKNITIDITPRNQGHKVSELDSFKRKNSKSRISVEDKIKMQQLNAALSVQSTSQSESAKIVSKPAIDISEESKRISSLKSGHHGNKVSKKSQSEVCGKNNSDSAILDRCERRRSPERPRSATKSTNRSATPVTTVTVAYGDTEEANATTKTKRRARLREKDVVTMVQQISSDSDSDNSSHEEEKLLDEKITPDKLEPWMPTKCTSDSVKNYYEISRQLQTNSAQEKIPEKKTDKTQVYKTTKTIEFDEYKPKETSVKSIIDNNQLLINRDREKFVGLIEGEKPRKSTPTVGDRLHSQPLSDRGQSRSTFEKNKGSTFTNESSRPSSRAGFVAMAPDKPMGKKMLRRPLSATKQSRPASASTTKPKQEDVSITTFSFDPAAEKKISEKAKEESKSEKERQREQEIENLINKHLRKQPVARPVSPEVSTEMSSPRDPSVTPNNTDMQFLRNEDIPSLGSFDLQTPSNSDSKIPSNSDHLNPSNPSNQILSNTDIKENVKDKISSSSRSSVHDKVKSSAKETKVSNVMLHLAENSFHSKTAQRHYASYSRGRVKSAPVRRKTEPKIRYTKPLYLNTNKEEDEVVTDVDIETHLLHNRLAENGVYIKPDALERALYPPSGRTTYYQINATLPKRTSQNLLSHPKVWLPVEYKQLRLAEKNLEKANEIMRRQALIEERKARLAEQATDAKKKKKKKGKKKGTLRRSNSFT